MEEWNVDKEEIRMTFGSLRKGGYEPQRDSVALIDAENWSKSLNGQGTV